MRQNKSPFLRFLFTALAAPGLFACEPSEPGYLVVGHVISRQLVEISGIARSQHDPDLVWVHNDSGDLPRVFALRSDGSLQAEMRVQGAFALDWEDVTSAPGPEGQGGVLFIADTGNNLRVRKELMVYRIPEPKLKPGGTTAVLESEVATRFPFKFSDGSFDCEGLAAAPDGKALYVFTKQGRRTGVYRLPVSKEPSGAISLDRLATLEQTPGVTSADLARDGNSLVVSTGRGIYSWHRHGTASVEAMLAQPPQLLIPLDKRLQLEAICHDRSGTGVFAIAEGATPRVYRIAMRPPSKP